MLAAGQSREGSIMSIDRIVLIAVAAGAVAFGASRAQSGAADAGGSLTINHVIPGGASQGVSFIWVIDDVHHKVAICTAAAKQNPACNPHAASMP
jgi:hypothetical protein